MLRISPQRIPIRRNRLIALAIHYALAMVFPFRAFRAKYLSKQNNPPLADIKRILIVRLDGLGDMVMSTPAFKGIRKIFPDAHITLLTATSSKDMPDIINLGEPVSVFNRILCYDAFWLIKGQRRWFVSFFRILMQLRDEKFDLIIDLRGDFRHNVFMSLCGAQYRLGFGITGCGFLLTHLVPLGESQHPVDSCVSLVNYLKPSTISSSDFGLCIPEADRSWVVSFMRKKGIVCGKDMIVLVHPGAKWKGRHWVPERYAEAADYLMEKHKIKVIFTGSCDDVQQVEKIMGFMRQKPLDLSGELSLRQFLGLVSKSDIFLGVDSGPMHMAVAVKKVRVVVLMGPARPEAIGPYGKRNLVITKQDNFSCSPCAQTVCSRPMKNCMAEITTADVIQAVENQLKEVFEGKARHANTSD